MGDSKPVHGNLAERLANVIDPHEFSQLGIDLKLAEISENVRITIWCEMGEKDHIVIIFEFIAKCQGIGFLELILLVVNVSVVEVHIQSLGGRFDCPVVVEIVDVEPFSVPLDAVSFLVSPSGVDEGSHAKGVQAVVFHEIEHVKLHDSPFFHVATAEVKPLSQGIVGVGVLL